MLFIVRAFSKTRQCRLSWGRIRGGVGRGRVQRGEEPTSVERSGRQTLHTLTCQGRSTERGQEVNKKLHLLYKRVRGHTRLPIFFGLEHLRGRRATFNVRKTRRQENSPTC